MEIISDILNKNVLNILIKCFYILSENVYIF
jgi:hypothetical protein